MNTPDGEDIHDGVDGNQRSEVDSPSQSGEDLVVVGDSHPSHVSSPGVEVFVEETEEDASGSEKADEKSGGTEPSSSGGKAEASPRKGKKRGGYFADEPEYEKLTEERAREQLEDLKTPMGRAQQVVLAIVIILLATGFVYLLCFWGIIPALP
ncbi:MAG: hypothetical protein ACOYIK_09365 [Coriobacteriales bacterium]